MIQDETLKADEDLTVTNSEQENLKGSTEPSEEDANGILDGAKNFQHALQRKQERIKELERELRIKSEAEKQKKLADMDETERWKLTAEEEQNKRAQLEIKLIVERAIKGKSISEPVLAVLRETPWVFPAIKRELTIGESSWDETIDAVERNIDSVVGSLESQSTETPMEPKRVDSERSGNNTTITKNRTFTLREVEEMDDATYAKNKEMIFKSLKENGGRLP